jgi:hypothetical protein
VNRETADPLIRRGASLHRVFERSDHDRLYKRKGSFPTVTVDVTGHQTRALRHAAQMRGSQAHSQRCAFPSRNRLGPDKQHLSWRRKASTSRFRLASTSEHFRYTFDRTGSESRHHIAISVVQNMLDGSLQAVHGREHV